MFSAPTLQHWRLNMNTATANPSPTDYRKWLTHAGKISFWFFFVKGTLWMAAALVFYYLR